MCCYRKIFCHLMTVQRMLTNIQNRLQQAGIETVDIPLDEPVVCSLRAVFTLPSRPYGALTFCCLIYQHSLYICICECVRFVR